MPDNSVPKQKFWSRFKDSYRISIIDVEHLEEVGSYHLSVLNFYIFLSFAGLLLSSIVISLIVFTPVKRLIPGYGDINENRKFIELQSRITALEEEVSSYEIYTDGLKNFLTGNAAFSDNNSSDSIKTIVLTNPQVVNQADLSENKRAKELEFLKFATPVSGKVAARFQPEIQHFGIDILAAKDTPIKSIMDGIVLSADLSIYSGNSLIIQHPKNVVSVYKHNSVLLVKTGDIVKTGQAIAIIGNTGELSTGPHLHFEMWYDGKFLNPENYITF